MVFELVYSALIAFVFITSAVYLATLRALDVYFDPAKDSFFLPENTPRRR